MRSLLLSAALLVFGAWSAPRAAAMNDSAASAFQAGNAAYERGEFAEAAAAYERAEKRAENAGTADARLFYNHGNALFRMNRVGPAILRYETARRLAPADPDILHNLAFARARAGLAAPASSGNPFQSALETAQASYTARAGLWIAIALFAAGFLLPSLGLFLPAAGRIACVSAAALSVTGLLLFSPLLVLKLRAHTGGDHAVVLEADVPLRNGPGAEHETILPLPEGTVLTITAHGDHEDNDGGDRDDSRWLEVAAPDGRRGYVSAAQIGIY